jgi:serine/threonine protein kinase
MRRLFCRYYLLHLVVRDLTRLTGEGPFTSRSFNSTLAKNKAAVIRFNHQNLTRASPHCLDLLKKMLHQDPKQRISAAEAINHPFLAASVEPEQNLLVCDEGISDNLKNFHDQYFLFSRYKTKFKSLIQKKRLDSKCLGMSFEMKAGGEITGNTDSLKDSQELDPESTNIHSLAYVAGRSKATSPGKQPNNKESFFKAVLLTQVKHNYPEEHYKLAESIADSQSEGSHSEDENEEVTYEIHRKKSKFGPRS